MVWILDSGRMDVILHIVQRTEYPWTGAIRLTVKSATFAWNIEDKSRTC
jgi:DUF1680 family protein